MGTPAARADEPDGTAPDHCIELRFGGTPPKAPIIVVPDGGQLADRSDSVRVCLTGDGAEVHNAVGKPVGSLRSGELVSVDGWSVAMVELATEIGPTSFAQGLLQARLVLDAGPSTGGYPRERALRPDPDRVILVGRAADSTIVLDDPKVSRRHFEISFRPTVQEFWLRNLSQNGTRVDGALITDGESRRLVHGDSISAGDSTLTFFNACRWPDLPPVEPDQDANADSQEGLDLRHGGKKARSGEPDHQRRDGITFTALVVVLLGLMGLLIWTLCFPGPR